MAKIKFTIAQLLERKHELKLIWEDPWPAGLESRGFANVRHSAWVSDCIEMARAALKRRRGRKLAQSATDEEMLHDWIVVHYAQVDLVHLHSTQIAMAWEQLTAIEPVIRASAQSHLVNTWPALGIPIQDLAELLNADNDGTINVSSDPN